MLSQRQHGSHQRYNNQRGPCNYLNAELPNSVFYDHVLNSGSMRVSNNNSSSDCVLTSTKMGVSNNNQSADTFHPHAATC